MVDFTGCLRPLESMLLVLEDIGEVEARQCEGYRGSYDPINFFTRSLTTMCRMESREFNKSRGGTREVAIERGGYEGSDTDSQVWRAGGGGFPHQQTICQH